MHPLATPHPVIPGAGRCSAALSPIRLAFALLALGALLATLPALPGPAMPQTLSVAHQGNAAGDRQTADASGGG